MEDTGIFAKQKINFRPPDVITHLAAANNVLILALANGLIYRIPLQEAEKQDEIDLPRGVGDRIAHVHVDPTGQHVLISSAAGDVFYLSRIMQQPKALHKMKGNVISAVGWNQEMCNDSSTAFIVVGTNRGLLFECEIGQSGTTSYFKQLYCVSDDPTEPCPVTGVQLHRCSSPANRWLIFVCTPGLMYALAGTVSFNPTSSGSWTVTDPTPALYNIFSNYQLNPGRIHTLDPSAPADAPSCLEMYPMIGDDAPDRFAWLAAPGVKYGKVDSTASDPFNMCVETHLYSHPEVNGRPDLPVGMVLTEFHILLLYKDRLTAVCNLNERIMYEDMLGRKFGTIKGISRDPVTGSVWVFTDRSVLKYRPVDEAKYVWRIFLDRGDYISARKYASGDQEALDLVLRKDGDRLIKEQKYTAAAEVFAMTKAPFEETALKFVQAEDREGLRTFLEKRLDQLEPMEKTQQAMLVLWLLELHLTELGEAKSGHVSADSQSAAAKSAKPQTAFDPHRYRNLRDQFRYFLGRQNVLECLKVNSQAVYQMMTGHGDVDSILYFADLMRDYETVVNLYVQQEHYEEALNILKKQGQPSLFYRFSATLMSCIPSKLVDAWIAQRTLLNPKRLLPAMFDCDKERDKAEQAIRYLEYCVVREKCTDAAVHNYLLSLYARFKPEMLLKYLHSQGTDAIQVCYDLKYALRLCAEKGLLRASVHVYCVLGLFEEAVVLALKEDVDLAKNCVRLCQSDTSLDFGFGGASPEYEDLRKKLWLRIACHVVEKEQDIEKCMELLQESEGLIKIQDLLPFFPDFVTIDHFKDSLCACLKEHSGKIQELQREMKDATEVAEDIRKDMEKMRNRYVVVRVQDKCVLCNDALMTRAFYAFPCSHYFHSNCLEQQLIPSFPEDKMQLVASLNRQLAALTMSPSAAQNDALSVDSMAIGGTPTVSKQEQEIRQELDDLLAAECPWCGQWIIDTLNQPFYTPQEYMKELRSWNA